MSSLTRSLVGSPFPLRVQLLTSQRGTENVRQLALGSLLL
jgi:hypothetical protein